MTSQVWRGRRWVAGAVAAVAVLGPVGALASAGAVTSPAAQKPGSDRTSATEAQRVDSVPTPKLAWRDCVRPFPIPAAAQCATVLLPLDYDQPNGAMTKVALSRLPARDQAHRIGSLFVNPGGPGNSGTALALGAAKLLSPALLDRFDVVGVDPRGVALSDQVRCFTSIAQQTKALEGLGDGLPMGKVEERAFLASARNMAMGCSSTGRPLSAAMSTAEVARDMDVLRRAVGDPKLTFYGRSYGTYLGQVYANMFPDRVRAVAIDGVVDPVAWAGTTATASRPQFDRLRSADGASRALLQVLRLCDRAGEQKCRFAPGSPVANYDLLAERLKKTQLVLEDPSGRPLLDFTYAHLVGQTLQYLYARNGYARIDSLLSELMILTGPPSATRSPAAAADRAKAMKALVILLGLNSPGAARQPAYFNGIEAEKAVECSDGLNPSDSSPGQLVAAAAAADKRARYFGRAWAWKTAACASSAWTVGDEDAYRGPFNRRTASPVLVVGNKWDPATNGESAVKVAALLPNSRLLSSDHWGHLAYGTSTCVTSAMDNYLLTQAVPARGTNCHGDEQPFQDDPAAPPS